MTHGGKSSSWTRAQQLATDTVSSRELRFFGLIVAGIFGGLFGLAMPLLRGHPWPLWPWVFCVPFVGLALIAPDALKYVFILWSAVGYILGAINTRLIVTIIYSLMIVPMGLIMRAFGKDPLTRNIDRELVTYRVLSRKTPRSSMEKPF